MDILINNAGLALFGEQEKTLTEDGNELTLQSNHLGHFLLTNLLMDKMEEHPGSRIVNVSSIAHARPTWSMPRNRYLDINDLNFDSNEFDGVAAYGCSKLANILFTKELARRLKNTTTSVLHPGVIETEIWRHFSIGAQWFQSLHRAFRAERYILNNSPGIDWGFAAHNTVSIFPWEISSAISRITLVKLFIK